MGEEQVVIARYSLPMEAQLACGRLHAEGIAATVTGDDVASPFAGILGVSGCVELHVPAADVERAEAILAAVIEDQQANAGARQGDQLDTPIWVCSLCGDAVSVAETVCAAADLPDGYSSCKK